MKKNNNEFLLKFLGFQSLLMSVYHFYLPYQFNWFEFLPKNSPTVGWATIALNNYFSFNLLVLASLFLFNLYKKSSDYQSKISLAIALCAFWIFSAIYQLIEPMPLPKELSFIGLILQTLAWFNAVLFALGIRRVIQVNNQCEKSI